MYLTYDEFTEFGGTLDEATFNLLEFQAESEIDWYTFNRLQNEVELPDKVKQCMYFLIEMIYTKQAATSIPLQNGTTTSGASASIASQSNDGVSISYNVVSASEIVEKYQDEIKSCIQKYLQGVKNSLGRKILYRGIYPGE